MRMDAVASPRFLRVPRGCLDDLRHLIKEHRIAVELQDERTAGRLIDVSFRGELLDQWRERRWAFLGLPSEGVGQIGGSQTLATGHIDVAVL